MGLVTFDGVTLQTAPGEVMTPRATSERLVAAASELADGPAQIADVGTGSGALAIAIAVRQPRARIWATDIDERAIALASANVARLDLLDRVFVRRGDLLEPSPAPLDMIMANLPYLPARSAACHPELIGEPWAAVFSGGDGLDNYRRLIRQAASKLSPEGVLLLQLHEEVLVEKRADLPALWDELPTTVRPDAACRCRARPTRGQSGLVWPSPTRSRRRTSDSATVDRSQPRIRILRS
jgi:release factor glutamine methyltransferase